MTNEGNSIPWPTEPSEYEIKRTIGCGATSLVQTAFCKAKNEHVAIKIVDFEQTNSIIEEIQKEIQAMHMCSHENVATYYTSFVNGTELWIVMKLMDAGSALDLIKRIQKHPDTNPINGIMSEALILAILKEVIKALQHFHSRGQIHRDIKAGNILLSCDGSVKLGDFGVSAVIMDYGDRDKIRKTFVGTPCWMAPEVMEQKNGYDFKSDIWSLGITTLEFVTGKPPYAGFPPMKVLLYTLNNPPPTLESCAPNPKDHYKQYSKQFRKFIEKCLQKDPSLRPDTTELLKMKIFKHVKDKAFLAQQFSYYNASLSDCSHLATRHPQSDGYWQQDPAGFWIWPEDKQNLTASPSQPKRDASADYGEQKDTGQTSDIIYGITLRIRTQFGDMNDIFFQYICSKDKPEKVVNEMVSANLVNMQDLICISANLQKLIDPSFNSKSITFPLKSTCSKGSPDEHKLIGFAQLFLEESSFPQTSS